MNSGRVLGAIVAVACSRLVSIAPLGRNEIKADDNVAPDGQPNSNVSLVVVLLVDSLGLFLNLSSYGAEPLSYLEIALLLLVLVGTAMRFWCYAELGQFFTCAIMTRPNHQLVQSGPYRWFVHPSYTCQFMAWFGTIFLLMGMRSVWIAPLMGYSVFVLFKRMRIEERHLGGVFGQAYSDYTSHRWRLVPGY